MSQNITSWELLRLKRPDPYGAEKWEMLVGLKSGSLSQIQYQSLFTGITVAVILMYTLEIHLRETWGRNSLGILNATRNKKRRK